MPIGFAHHIDSAQVLTAAALEASLRQAGAAHVVRNFDELRGALDPQLASC